ncbi:hypothetical protein pb186bvf_012761 [Paramecium bursaria]
MQKVQLDKITTLQDQNRQEMMNEIEQFENTDFNQVTSIGLKTKMMSEFMRKERDKRRRKMIVDQEKQSDELARREIAVLDKLKQQSKQEKEIMYEIWRAYQCKEVIIQNRMLRDESYKNKQELNIINMKFKEEEMLRTLQLEFNEEVECQTKRQLEINVEYKLQSRQHNYEKCKSIVDVLFEIAEQCFEHIQNQDNVSIKEQFLRENHKLFIDGKELIPYKRFRTFDPIKQLKLQESLFQKEKKFLAQQEMKDYIEGSGNWNFYQSQNNFILGNLVRYLIEQQIQNSEQQSKTDIPFLPFKCAIIGFAFSGKRSISELLQKKYGITLLSIDQLINELLEYLYVYQSSTVHSQVWDQSLISLGSEVQQCILQGQHIEDELYVRVIEQKIKRLFPVQNFDQLYEEYQELGQQEVKHAKIQDISIQEGLNWEDFHKANMVNKKLFCKGWLLYDFPHNYNQAKLLEKYLTGTEPQDNLTPLEARLQQAERVVKPNPYNIVPRTKSPSGTGVCVYLQMPSNELSLRRALGRRNDLHTNSQYHLDTNTPPVDNAPLIERIKPVYEVDNLQQTISDKNSYFMTQIEQIQNWYENFEAKVVIEQDEEIIEQEEIPKEIEAATENNNEEDQLPQYRDVVRKVRKNEIIKQSAFQIVDASVNVEKVFYEVDKVIQIQLEIQAQIVQQEQRKKQQLQQQKEQEEQKRLEQEELNKKCVQRPLQLDVIPQKSLSQSGKDLFYKLWNSIESKYTNQIEYSFRWLREQREFVSNYLMDIQKKFIDLILTPDEKLHFVRLYQEQYNNFLSENPDLAEEDACKEELHQRVDDLFDQIVDQIDQKKEDLNIEKQAIVASQFIENEIDLYLNVIRLILQGEMDRSTNSIQLLNDYYSILEGIDLPEMQLQQQDLPMVEGDDPFIRLEKLVSESQRIYNGEEEQVDDKNKKGGKAPKKDDLKKGKKGKEVEEPKKELQNPEAQQAIALEKQIFKDRLEAIKTVAQAHLRQLKQAADQLYQKLDDWIFYTHHTELKALESICGLFRQYIEKEEKIQKEIQLKFVDVIISHEILNFLTPIPPPLTAREPVTKSRFSVSQLYNIIEDLRSITSTHLLIEIKALSQMLARQSGVLKLSPSQWMKALKILDQNGNFNRYVNVRQICTYLILLTSPVPREEDIQQYQQYLGGAQVNKDTFVGAPAWFDDYEKVNEEENTNYFDRVTYIKELLFFVHKDENDNIGTKQYLEILQVQGERYLDYLLSRLN